MKYDVVIIGAGPAGIFSALTLSNSNKNLKILIIDKGNQLERRKCPISNNKTDKCINCSSCSIMCGFGGAGAFSDGKFNITNDFGGSLWKKIGLEKSIEFQKEVDSLNASYYIQRLEKLAKEANYPYYINNDFPKLFDSSKYLDIKSECLKDNLHLMEAKIRHLGTDKNYIILKELFEKLKNNNVDFLFNTEIYNIIKENNKWIIKSKVKDISCDKLIIAVGRSGSKWLEGICDNLKVERKSNKVDIGVRVEIPFEVSKNLTDKLYESKIVFKTKLYEDLVRTFCMNPHGIVVSENTNGIITVNGHSYEDKEKHTPNTNFALLVSQEFTEPFNNSNEYGESIAKLSNMLGNGVIVQRFGDLIRCKRTTNGRLNKNTVVPTLKAEPGDLALVLPHRILEDIKETIYALDNVMPGIKNDDTLLYGVEVKFYNNEIKLNEHLEADKNLYVIGDCSGVTHSLSQAAASGLFVAEDILCNIE